MRLEIIGLFIWGLIVLKASGGLSEGLGGKARKPQEADIKRARRHHLDGPLNSRKTPTH